MVVFMVYVTWLLSTKLRVSKSFCIFLVDKDDTQGLHGISAISQILYYFIKSKNALSWHL